MGPYGWGFLNGVACTWDFIFGLGILIAIYECVAERIQAHLNQGGNGNQQAGRGGNQGAGSDQACDNMAPNEASKEAMFQMRFGAKRLAKVVQKNMNDAKRATIAKTPFKQLLNVASFAAPPMVLIEYVVKHTNPKLREFRHKNKSILFTRDMVVKVLGVPSGVCGEDTDEALVVQSFGLIAFATVLCPGTGNLVKCECLSILMDANEIDQYAIDEHILKETMGEVELFKEKLLTRSKLDPSQIVWIAMCLPMLATIYMDFLSFPPLGPREHTINRSTPRFCHLCDDDFRLVEIDKNKLSLDPAAFGVRPLLPLSKTLYAVVAPTNGNQPHVDPGLGGDDGLGSEEVDVNPSASLNEWLEKGFASSQELQVPEHLQGLYNKHKTMYATDVGAGLHNFGEFLKASNAKRMAALLVDVHAANVASSSFTIPCPATPDVHAKEPSPIMVEEDVLQNVVTEDAMDIGEVSNMARSEPSPEPSHVPSPALVRPSEHSSEPSPVPSPEHTRVPSPEPTREASPVPSRVPSPEHTSVPFPEPTRAATPVPSSPEHISRVASPSSGEESPRIKSPSKYPADFWDDVPKMDLFEPGSEDAKFFAAIPDAAATSGGSCVVVMPVRKEDVAQSIVPAASTLQEAKGNASSGPDTHDKKQRQKRAANDIDTPPKIGNFFVPYKNFLAVFKPRQYMDNQIMSLYVEKFNIENQLQASRNKRSRKKFAFSVRMTSELIKDPAKLQTKDVIEEFKIACEKYKISKMDLLWFPIVNEKHWATCCINLLHSQINSFDSIKPSKKGGSMESAMNNLRLKPSVLTSLNSNVEELLTTHSSPTCDFDCGFFMVLYMDKFHGKVMENFDENGIPYFRMILATDFITHPMNREDSAKDFEEETYE
ncbi:hypothetical protein ACQ4PT_061619 [Festuca glaucescens]